MLKWLKNHMILTLVLIFAFAGLVYAGTISEKRYGVATPYWYGMSDLYTVSTYYLAHPTLSANDTAAGIAATQTLTNKTLADPTLTGTVTGAGLISGTNVADVTRSFPLDLAAGGIDGGNDVDDASTPDITSLDGIPAIVWADSSETTAVGWTFRLPSDFVSGLVVYALISSNAASGSGQILDWAVFVNTDGTAFDASPFAQTEAESTEAALNTKNDVLTLTSDTTSEAAYTAGAWVTLEFFNASTDDDDLELKGLEVTYTATQ